MRIKLSIKLMLSEIREHIEATTEYPRDALIEYICFDTRETENGDLFIALSGKHDSGEKYVTEQLCKKAWVITTKPIAGALCVKDTGAALLALAKYYKRKLKSLKYTVAITGSVGKTTTKEFVNILLSKKYKTHKSFANQNNEIGVPITVLQAAADTEVLIAEVGMNHSGEISRISDSLKPDVSVITNIGTAHIGNLGSREAIAAAKLEIKKGMQNGILITPSDEPLLNLHANRTFSVCDKNASFCITKNKIFEDSFFRATHSFSLVEDHFLLCLAAAVSTARCLSLEYDEIKDAISQISYNNTRQKITQIDKYYILEDYYNASLESIRSNLDALSKASGFTLRNVLLGDVLELGELSYDIHRKIGEATAEYNIDKLFLYGKYSGFVKEGALSRGFPSRFIFVNEDISAPEITAQQIIDNVTAGEIILFKASHDMHLENIQKILLSNSQMTKGKE